MDFGPVLPPHLRKNEECSDSDQSDQGKSFGPVIPKHLVKIHETDIKKNSKEYKAKEPTEPNKSQNFPSEQISVGPQLPPQLQERLFSENKEENSEESDEDDCYGPALPPGFEANSDHNKERTLYTSPALPPHLIQDKVAVIDESSDEDEMIGPMPSAGADEDEYLERAKWEIEARSRATKDKMTGKKDDKMTRETWMTELPPELGKNFGLGARKFRAHAVELGDQSVWTDTPADRARKMQEGAVKRKKEEPDRQKTSWEQERDSNMEKIVEQHNKRHRGESLMDMHKKKIKKKKEEEAGKPKERRPFDREQDLVLHKVTDKERKSFIKKSQELGSRFQSARQGSAYL